MLQVEIIRDKYGCLFACVPSFMLFKFVYRPEKDLWLFWLGSHFNPVMFAGKKFPEAFFNDACRAKFFILNGGPAMHDSVKITKGRRYVEF